MGMLGMSDREFDFYQHRYAEAMKLIGQDAILYPSAEVFSDLSSDKTIISESGRKVGIIFEDNPRPILKKYQWLTEEENLPYVAYISPMDHFEIPFTMRDQMIIQIASKYALESERLFVISNVRASSIDPLMYVVKLVPHRPKVDFDPTTPESESTNRPHSDTGYSYLNVGGSV